MCGTHFHTMYKFPQNNPRNRSSKSAENYILHLPCSAPWMLWGRHYTELPGINWNAHIMAVYKVENQHVLTIKSQTNDV